MRSIIIAKAREDEQQIERTDVNNIQNFVPLKKLIKKVILASDKTETKQNNLNYARKDMGPLNYKAR